MPYTVKGKCIFKKEDNSKVGCTKGDIHKYLAALHANANENTLIGGKADKITNIDDLYNYWAKIDKTNGGVSKNLKKELEHEIALGKQIEREHTSDNEKIIEIVFDHLVEDKEYYTKSKPKDWAEKEISKERNNENIRKFIKQRIREEFTVTNDEVFLDEPYDNIKTTIVNGHKVYILFGDVDYYQNKENILAIKRKSDTLKLNKQSYSKFLQETKKRFDSIPDLKNVDVVTSIETTAPITDEIANILDKKYIKHGLSKTNKNFKMKDIPLDKRNKVNGLFDLNLNLDKIKSIAILDDFITTGTSFKNAFNTISNDINTVGVCLFLLKS